MGFGPLAAKIASGRYSNRKQQVIYGATTVVSVEALAGVSGRSYIEPLVGARVLAKVIASGRSCMEPLVGVGYSNSWRQVMYGATSGCWLQ